MKSRTLASWMLEQEARALLTRLDRVKPFVLQETMVPAAGLMPGTQVAIERYLMSGRKDLRERVRQYVGWVRGPGQTVSPEELQRRFTVLKLWFNTALSQLDLFAEALSQRSEHETGVWLSGLDVAAQDALALPGRYYDAPPVVCYLHRGLGGAIRRARTRLPGGGENPVAIIRIPRERMIGYGVASSLVHEVGHQAAALLHLVESLRPALQRIREASPPEEQPAWRMWERWISEIVADFWAIAKVGIASTLGLIGIVSLPRPFVFRVSTDDPHPFPWARVNLSCAVGQVLYPHRQWGELARTWRSFYPIRDLDPGRRQVLQMLGRTMPRFIETLAEHRPASLQGQTLREVVSFADRTPDRLQALYTRWKAQPRLMKAAPPTLVFAVIGRARAKGKLTPEEEDRLLGKLITHWAIRSTLDMAAICSTRPMTVPSRIPGQVRVPALVAS